MLHTKYIPSLYGRPAMAVAFSSLLLLASLFLSACGNNASAPVSNDDSEVTVGISLRSQEDGVYSVDKDKTDYEDEIRELRIILLQNDVIKQNHYYKAGEANNTLNYVVTNNQAMAKFKVENPDYYDMVVVANESVTAVGADTHSKLSSAQNRADLEAIEVVYEEPRLYIFPTADAKDVIEPEPEPIKHPRMRCPMTAEYINVDIRYPDQGKRDHVKNRQYTLTVPSKTGKIELLRAFAKLELIFKDFVYKRTPDDPSSAESEYVWAFPDDLVELHRILASTWVYNYPLLPRNKFATPKDLYPCGQKPKIFNFNTFDIDPSKEKKLYIRGYRPFEKQPDKQFVVEEPSLGEESIGGIRPLDYRLVFYLPETLLPDSLSEDESISGDKRDAKYVQYSTYGLSYDMPIPYSRPKPSDWIRPRRKHIISLRPFKNNDHSSDYLKEHCADRGLQMLDFSDKSIFRNCNYRVTVSFDKDRPNPNSAPLLRMEDAVAQ